MARKHPAFGVGTSDFKRLVDDGFYIVDKTHVIQKVHESPDQIMLLPRPRRFGKTTNLSMLRYFYGSPEEKALFQKLAIGKQKALMKRQGKYPVIYLTFKDAKRTTWENCHHHLISLIRELYDEHMDAISSPQLTPLQSESAQAIYQGKATGVDYADSLKLLIKILRQVHGERVVVLIDEYDVPIHSGHQYGYYQEAVGFVRSFMSGAFKDNMSLERAVITGILKVAKESIFSGLNNIRTHSLLSPEFSDCFGFTEEEIQQIVSDFKISEELEDIQSWYNGYDFGGRIIYNPWSIIQYANTPELGLMPYWLNSGSYDLVQDLVLHTSSEVQKKMEQLIRGEAIQSTLNENIVFTDIQNSEEHIFSFLVFSGYLKASNPRRIVGKSKITYDLRVPNREVLIFYQDVIQQWLRQGVGSEQLQQMLRCLLEKQFDDFESYFSDMVRQFLSFYDTAGDEPEKVYHAFVLGLLVNLENQYIVRSNREAGYGRYDLLLTPRDVSNPGFIFEFKKLSTKKEEVPKAALQSALDQIKSKNYADELKVAGVTDITSFGIVIDQKQTWMTWV